MNIIGGACVKGVEYREGSGASEALSKMEQPKTVYTHKTTQNYTKEIHNRSLYPTTKKTIFSV